MNSIHTEPSLRGAITRPTLLLMHLLAGKSILTVRSRRSGERMTLRFSRPDEDSNNAYVLGNYQGRKNYGRPIWVSLYGGPEGGFTNDSNERRNWTFLGTIRSSTDPAHAGDDQVQSTDGRFTYRASPKSKLPDDSAMPHRCAAWIAYHLPDDVDVLMEQAEWWHEGVCGRCGRRLTVPESIDTGFGPECRKTMGL